MKPTDNNLRLNGAGTSRRKLLVGGGAAALAAFAGGGILPAAAATIDAAPNSTADHARQVLDLVNADLGMVDPTTLQSRFEQSFAAYKTSAPRDPKANDVDAWARQRMVDLCGTDSYTAAVSEIPQTRTLLAFGFLAYTQRQDVPLPQIARSMPVPAVLSRLEADFLPVLLGQIDSRSKGSPAFATGLKASSAELDKLVATLSASKPIAMQPAHPTDGDVATWAVATIVFLIVYFSHK